MISSARTAVNLVVRRRTPPLRGRLCRICRRPAIEEAYGYAPERTARERLGRTVHEHADIQKSRRQGSGFRQERTGANVPRGHRLWMGEKF